MYTRPTNVSVALLNAASKNINHPVTTSVLRHAFTDDVKRPFLSGYNVAEVDHVNVNPVVSHRAWIGANAK
jgi:hypothetical protein